MALEQGLGDDEGKDGVPEELESFVGLACTLRVLVHVAAVNEGLVQQRGVRKT
jgi:hypothetical protein